MRLWIIAALGEKIQNCTGILSSVIAIPSMAPLRMLTFRRQMALSLTHSSQHNLALRSTLLALGIMFSRRVCVCSSLGLIALLNRHGSELGRGVNVDGGATFRRDGFLLHFCTFQTWSLGGFATPSPPVSMYECPPPPLCTHFRLPCRIWHGVHLLMLPKWGLCFACIVRVVKILNFRTFSKGLCNSRERLF